MVQVVADVDGAVATGTTAFPDDDTIPQIDEGECLGSRPNTTLSL